MEKHYLQTNNLNFVSPIELRLKFAEDLNLDIKDIFILGDILNRILVIRNKENTFEFFPIQTDTLSVTFIDSHHYNISNIAQSEISYVITFIDPIDFIKKIEKPHVKLVSLYHQENFPLPRFPLGISDIASAIRKNFLGQVSLCDMQFYGSALEVFDDIESQQPDILGISATFGQQDLLEELVKKVQSMPNYNPLVIFGGSLSALNYERLLTMFPNSIVAKGYGETTMQDIIKYWLGLIQLEEINLIAYFEDGVIKTTGQHKDDKLNFVNPELDLLERTLIAKGVMQLESSRGCTYHCSFCPRSHKGQWSGEAGGEFEKLMPFIKNIFIKYPTITPKIFLVDEEFVGYKYLSVGVQIRALQIAELLKAQGFKFESSTRIDQVYNPVKAESYWHIDRIEFWKKIVVLGLDRMLFGVESGVDSILKRFNKKTTAKQNVIAIRILTTIGVPLRLTYITFDPLMTLEELILSYNFQGRKDILLNANNSLSSEQILNAVFDEDYISKHSSEQPLFREITYLLVSMESLIGSQYLELVQDAGLAGEHVFSMGKRSARYKDENIGLISLYCQKWVDRNFALDYLLKSIIKIGGNSVRSIIIKLRLHLRNFSYSLLGKMLVIVTEDIQYLYEPEVQDSLQLADMILELKGGIDKEEIFQRILQNHFHSLQNKFEDAVLQGKDLLSVENFDLIMAQVNTWKNKKSWDLINIK